jgi:hypothetical protein
VGDVVRPFLRPTWVTWAVVLLPVVLVPILQVFRFDATLFAVSFLVIDLPFETYRQLGIQVGRRASRSGDRLEPRAGE